MTRGELLRLQRVVAVFLVLAVGSLIGILFVIGNSWFRASHSTADTAVTAGPRATAGRVIAPRTQPASVPPAMTASLAAAPPPAAVGSSAGAAPAGSMATPATPDAPDEPAAEPPVAIAQPAAQVASAPLVASGDVRAPSPRSEGVEPVGSRPIPRCRRAGWYVQAGAFERDDRLQQRRAAIRALGYTSCRVSLRQRPVEVLFVGPFDNRRAAERARLRLVDRLAEPGLMVRHRK